MGYRRAIRQTGRLTDSYTYRQTDRHTYVCLGLSTVSLSGELAIMAQDSAWVDVFPLPRKATLRTAMAGSDSALLSRYMQHDASRDPATRHGLSTRLEDFRATSSMPAAGKATRALNASFSACEYKPARLEPGRTFLLDDYEGRQCRAHRENLHLTGDACFQAMAYEKNITQFAPVQESAKFHAGFYRRQQSTIRQDAERKEREAMKEERNEAITKIRGERQHAATSFAYNG